MAPAEPENATQIAQASAAPSQAVTESGALEQVVVHARRRAESLISVPVAVSALSAAQLNQYSSTDLVRITQLLPQVEIQKGGSGAGATFIIRGIGSSATDPGLEQSVSVNLDGVQISRGRIMDQAMFDLAQVEVLKGPQALFFGKNSPAGVISVTSLGPSNNLEAYIRGGYEFNAGERFAEGALSGPITDSLKARIALRASRMDGWLENVATARPDPSNPSVTLPGGWARFTPNARDIAGRVTVTFEPIESFDSTLKVLAGRRKENSDTNFEVICASGLSRPTSNGFVDTQGVCETDSSLHWQRASSAFPTTYAAGTTNPSGIPFSEQTNTVMSLSNNLSFKWGTVTSVTGYYRIRKTGRDDSGTSSIGQIGGGADEFTRGVTEEIRAVSHFDGPLNFSAGGYLDNVDRDQFAELRLRYLPPDPKTGSYLSSVKQAINSGTTYSLFAQARWAILDNLELAGGARWSREEKSTEQWNSFVAPAFASRFKSPSMHLFTNYSNSDISPEATLTWHPDPNSTLYGAFKTGYKSGGVANPLILTAADAASREAFGPEKTRGGEVGYKARLVNGRLQTELVGYRYTIDGLQTSSFNNQLLSYLLSNAGAARTTGLEGSVEWRTIDELTLHTAFGYNLAKFVNFSNAPCYAGQTAALGCVGGTQNLTGKQLYRAPRWSVTAGLNYDRPIVGGLMIGFAADTRYTSSFIAEENYNPLSRQDSYFLVNSSVRIHAADDHWEFAFIGRNLLNTEYIGFAVDKPGGGPGQVAIVGNRPRELQIQAIYRY